MPTRIWETRYEQVLTFLDTQLLDAVLKYPAYGVGQVELVVTCYVQAGPRAVLPVIEGRPARTRTGTPVQHRILSTH